MGKEAILQYAKARYGTEPEYLWAKFPEHAVLRHSAPGRGKWYGVLLQVERSKLKLSGEMAWILNVKCDPALGDALKDGENILPAYHMNKEHWLSLLLDGSLPDAQIFDLLDMSYQLTK